LFKVKAVRTWQINADNFDETVSFYRDVLGGTEGPTRLAGEAPVTHVDVGGVAIGICDQAKGGRPGNPHHMLEIEWAGDLEQVTKELEGRGIRVESSRQQPDGRDYSLTLIDPTGNRIELSTSGRTAMTPR